MLLSLRRAYTSQMTAAEPSRKTSLLTRAWRHRSRPSWLSNMAAPICELAYSKPNYHDGIGVFALNFVILSHYRVDFFYITWYSQRDAIKEILLNINMDYVSCFPLKPMTGTWLICLPNVDHSLATHKLTRSCIPQLAELLTRSEPNVTDYWFNSENQQITYSL